MSSPLFTCTAVGSCSALTYPHTRSVAPGGSPGVRAERRRRAEVAIVDGRAHLGSRRPETPPRTEWESHGRMTTAIGDSRSSRVRRCGMSARGPRAHGTAGDKNSLKICRLTHRFVGSLIGLAEILAPRGSFSPTAQPLTPHSLSEFPSKDCVSFFGLALLKAGQFA